MTSPNHIVGGIAITGVSLSFWDINIFGQSSYLGVVIFASLLPDIDHTKSIIGKLFFPIAKYLDKNFGHRTITHSLTFFVPLTLVVAFVERSFISSNLVYTYIFLFGFLSHLILDMLTVQGIPLFYPFLRNPCVVPANPSYRIRSGNLKSESIAMALFTMVLMSSFDLFANGFWTSYNRSFGTIKHAYREFRSSEMLVISEYQYLFNGDQVKGSGYIIDANEEKAIIFNPVKKKVIEISAGDNRVKDIKILPKRTKHKYKLEDINLMNKSIDYINNYLKGRLVSGAAISSSEFIVSGLRSKNGSVQLDHKFSPSFQFIGSNERQLEINNKLEIKQSELNEVLRYNSDQKLKLKRLKDNLSELKSNLVSITDLYTKDKTERDIIDLESEINKFNLKLKPTGHLLAEIKALRSKLESGNGSQLSVSLQIFRLPSSEDEKLWASHK